MSPGTLLIRADASVAIGTGHVMRCLALAQAWQDAGGRAVILMSETTESIDRRLEREGLQIIQLPGPPGSIEDSDQTVKCAKEIQTDWLVVDGYPFGVEYQYALAKSGVKTLWLDDNGGCDFYSADIVLNQNIHADEAVYTNRSSGTKLLLGPTYALLRREFKLSFQSERSIPQVARNVVVTMGGSDPENYSQRVMEALSQITIEGLTVRLVVGGSNLNQMSLNRVMDSIPAHVELLCDVQNMAELLAWADLAVAAAGSISWEICALGVPAVLIPVADNQQRSASALNSLRAVQTVSFTSTVDEIARGIRELILSPSLRAEMSRVAHSLVDGQGSGRVVAAMVGPANGTV